MSQQQESKLLTAEFVSASLSKAELLRRLGKLYKFLKSMKQDNRSKSMLDSTAATLVQKELLTHKNSEVRLLTACCLADIIRIYAPDAPYDHSMISQVFQLFIQQLQRIGEVEDESFHLRFALLEKLAVVKAFIILVDKEDELLVQVFKTFFDAITPEHSVLVVTHMLDIMTSCLEECEEIPLELLDAILVNLLAKNKQEHPPSYLLARQLVQGCAELLQAAITQFLQSALVDANTSESELKDYAHELIWELNKISPTILLYVLPELERELKVEDLSKRKSVVKLLGEMFSAEGSLLPTSYPQLFNTFISRFNDIEPDIRLLMIQYVPQFIKNHPASHKSINEALQKRLRDLDEKVREAAVVAVCESAIFDPQALTNQILQEIGLRMRDKKLSIRTAAITKLAVLYRELVEKWGPQISWKPSHQNKFGWIPNSILHCCYQTDMAIRLLVEQILAEELLPKGAEVEERTRILVNLLPSLDEHAVIALSRILKDKKTFQTEFQAYLKARSRLTKSDGDDRQIDEQITNRITSLANKLPGSTARFQALHNLKVSQIWKGLALLADTDVEYQQVVTAEEDIFKGYRSKSSAGMEYLKLVVQKLSMNIVSQDCLPFLFAELKSLGKQSDQEKSAQAALKFLKELSSTFPSLFKGSLSDLSTLLEDEDPLLVDTVLEIFASVGGQLKRTSRLKKTLEKRLCQFAMEGSVSQAKCAVKAIHSVCREDKGMLAKLMRNLFSLITDPSKVAPSALQSLAQLAKMDADTFLSSPSQDRVVSFVMEELIVEAFPRTKNSRDKPSKLCIKKVLGMKLLVNYLRACHDAEGEDVDLNVPKQALELAYDIIEKNGEIVANTSTADAEKLVQCASSSILKLARYKYYDRLMSPEQIQAIAMVLKHPSFEVRDAMLDELWKGLKDLKLPLKYLSFFALAALDPQRKLAHKAKSYLTACIRVRREKLKALSSSNKSSASILPALLPEYALPYLIHLLAHRKDWKEDTPHYTNSAK
ncbi:Sister chromatid cohesion protein pds5, variant 3 [Balamuthia mandrillaris]